MTENEITKIKRSGAKDDSLREVTLPYEPLRRSVGWSVGRFIIFPFEKFLKIINLKSLDLEQSFLVCNLP